MTYPTIRPEITLDFQNSRQLDPRITFSRSSSATYLNPDTGLITSAYTDQARFEKEGLLIEESRTNLIPYSQVFATGYSGAQFTITDNAVVAPDGTTTAASLLETAVNDAHYVQLSSSSQTNLSQSIFVKPNGRDNICVRFVTTGSDWYTITFNLTGNGSITQEIAGTGSNWTINSKSITQLSNGWYRISAGATTSAATIYIFSVLGCDSSTPTLNFQYGYPQYTGDVTKGYYFWGAQVEANSLPTSYIPTSGSTVTRAADRPSVTGTNFSSWYNHNEGSFVAKVNDFGGTPPQFKIIFEGAKVNKYADFSLQISNLEPRFTTLYTFTNGTISLGSLPSNDTSFKMAGSYSSLGTAAVLNGGVVGTTGTTGVVDTNILSVDIGHRAYVNDHHLNGHISRLSYYTRRLSDSELQTITS